MRRVLMQRLRLPSLLNGTHLKLLALITMTIDHIGLLLLGNHQPFRIIGRLAFPIFAYMIAEGCRYTRNKVRYFGMIFGLGLLFQAVYILMQGSYYMNIMITLGLSIPIIYSLQFAKKRKTLPAALLPIGAVCLLFLTDYLLQIGLAHTNYTIDYTLAGVLLPVLISLSDRREIKLLLAGVGLLAIAAAMHNVSQLWSLLSLIPLSLYDGTPGRYRMKWLFYLYYPLHLVAIYAISMLI